MTRVHGEINQLRKAAKTKNAVDEAHGHSRAGIVLKERTEKDLMAFETSGKEGSAFGLDNHESLAERIPLVALTVTCRCAAEAENKHLRAGKSPHRASSPGQPDAAGAPAANRPTPTRFA